MNTPLHIKNLTIPGRLFLAPIAGYTDSPFRQIARRHGAAMTFSELVSAEGIIRGNDKTLELMRFTDAERPFALQIFGSDPSSMAEAARRVEQTGVDAVDINLGCPAPRVCGPGTNAGAALLKYPGQVEEIAAAVVRAVSIPVTAKIRIGWDAQNLTYREIMRALENSGVSMVAVHGRTKAQRYGGLADWEVIREIRERSRLVIVGNGDIKSFQDARMRLETSLCQAVMIGRGAIGNPWIFSGVTPSLHGIVNLVKEHLDLMMDFYGEYGVILMRKHIVQYFHGFRDASRIRKELVTATSRHEILDILGALS